MLLKVYDQYKNAVGYIRKYTDLEIDSELETGDKTLSFTYQNKDLRISDVASGLKRSAVLGAMVLGMAVLGSEEVESAESYDYIQNEYYIETPDDLYVVKEIGIDSNGYPEIVCQLDLEELEAEMVESFSAENMPIQDVANLALVGTGWRADTEGIDPEKLRSVATLKATPYTILGKIRDAWMCEMRFDTKEQIVYFRDEFGEDRGVFFSKTLNLRRLKLTDDSYDFYTRIVPIGEDDLRIDDVNDGKGYVENYQYSDKIKTLIWEDTSYTDAEALKEDAEAKLDDMSKPSRSYSADVVDLAKQSEKYSIMDFELGDTITLLDQESDIKDKQRIVKLKEYPDNPYKNSCELSNTTWTWEELQSKLQAAADAFEDISNADGTVNGYYVHGITSDGVLVLEKTVNPDGTTTTTTIGSLTDNLVTINNNVQEAYDSVLSVVGDIITISGELDAVYERVGTLEATSLTATEADLRYATIGSLDVVTADIENLYALYGNITSLVTDELAAKVANIENVLSGQIGTGSLESIVITTENAYVESAVILDALIGTVLADIIDANTIYTDVITIMSENGGIVISGNTIQISDENGIVRMQIGQDADGGFTFVIYDETGTGIMIDSEGIHESAVPDGLIVNDMVSDDANISASKIDMQGVTDYLNESGDLIIEGYQVTINGSTLDYELTQITQSVNDMSSDVQMVTTGLEVVQGQIEGKVWMSDIESVENELGQQIDSISEQYGDLVVTVDSISSEVGQLTTVVDEINGEYEELYSTVSNLTVDLDGISATVQEVADKTSNAITEGVPYYTASDSPDWYTPHGVEEETAVLGDMILGTAELGADPNGWTTEQPEYEEGMYTWVSYYRTRVDGSTYWTTPTLLTDEWERTKTNEISEQYAGIVIQIGNITSEVSSIYTEMSEDFYSHSQTDALIEQSANEVYASIIYDVSMIYATQDQLTEMDASITQYVNDTISSIKLSVSGGLGSSASITMTAGDTSTSADLDLTGVRQAFADDNNSAITISAGTITFMSNTFICDSDYFKVTAEGKITATSGEIGYMTIGDSCFTTGDITKPSDAEDDKYGMYMGDSGFLVASSQGFVRISKDNVLMLEIVTPYSSTLGFVPATSFNSSGTLALHEFGKSIINSPAGAIYIAQGSLICYYPEGTTGVRTGALFQVDCGNGRVYVDGSQITGSDESLKKDLALLKDEETSSDYEKVFNALMPVSFEYKFEPNNKHHYGFTYQNVIEALEAGGINPDDSAMAQMIEDPNTGESYGGIEYNDIVALLVYEVQKLKKQVETLSA